MELGEIPPQAIDLEEIVLGSIMLETDALIAIADIIKPEIFYKEAHQIICSAILTLCDKSEPVDIITVTQYLKRIDKLDQVGGVYFITSLTAKIASTANIEYHTRIILEKYRQRELIRISSGVLKICYENSCDVFEVEEEMQSELLKLNNFDEKQINNISDLSKNVFKDIEYLKNNPVKFTGVPAGYTDIDRITGGWQKSNLIIMAGRPGMGKSTFILNCAKNAAKLNKKVAFFSLEMSSTELIKKVLSNESEINLHKINHGNLDFYEIEKLREISNNINSNILIDDTAALSTNALRTKAIRLKKKDNIDLIIVDYLQLMKASGLSGKENREREINIISQSLKNLAKELNIPVIALSQLNRDVEKRKNKRPALADLREGGSIENDADIVIFLWRPEYYHFESFNFKDTTLASEGLCLVYFAKGRNIQCDEVVLKFNGAISLFSDYESSGNNEVQEKINYEKTDASF